MADYLTLLRCAVEQDRRALERLSNSGAPAHLVRVQRQRFQARSEELDRLTDYYSLSADHGVDA
jgi:hypothetical protein